MASLLQKLHVYYVHVYNVSYLRIPHTHTRLHICIMPHSLIMSYPHSRIIFIHAFTLTYISSESNIIYCDKTLVLYSVTFAYI